MKLAETHNHHRRQVVILGMLDVEKVFNFARWCDIERMAPCFTKSWEDNVEWESYQVDSGIYPWSQPLERLVLSTVTITQPSYYADTGIFSLNCT